MSPNRVLTFVLASILGFGIVAVVIRIPPASLTPLAWVLTVFAWIDVIVLSRAALRPPRIGALDERALVAVVIAIFGTIAIAIATNTDQGKPYFDAATASVLFRISIIAVLAIPSVWLVLWLGGRLGQRP